MLLQQSIEHVSIVYTCNTYFVMGWSMFFIWGCLVNVRIQYLAGQLDKDVHCHNDGWDFNVHCHNDGWDFNVHCHNDAWYFNVHCHNDAWDFNVHCYNDAWDFKLSNQCIMSTILYQQWYRSI